MWELSLALIGIMSILSTLVIFLFGEDDEE